MITYIHCPLCGARFGIQVPLEDKAFTASAPCIQCKIILVVVYFESFRVTVSTFRSD